MSKGQQAMAVAMVYPEPEKTTHGKKSKTKLLLETKTNFSGARLSQARTVLACSTDLALAVLAGTKALDAAYCEAKKAKARAVTVTAPASEHAANETDTAKPKPAPSDSVEALAEFKVACDLWLPQLNERDRDKASTHVNSMFEKLRNSRGSPGQAA
jgi:hypothetical protein